MPIIADYKVISDGITSLAIGSDIDRDFIFSLPSSGFRNQDGILFFVVSNNSTSALRLRVEFNDQIKLRATLTPNDHYVSLHEVIDGLKVQNNKLTFTLESGEGTLRVSDIVLYFQRNV